MNELYLKTVYTCKIIYDNIFGCLKVPSIDGACPNYCLRFILGFTCSFSYRVIFEIGISLSVCYFFFFSFSFLDICYFDYSVESLYPGVVS